MNFIRNFFLNRIYSSIKVYINENRPNINVFFFIRDLDVLTCLFKMFFYVDDSKSATFFQEQQHIVQKGDIL